MLVNRHDILSLQKLSTTKELVDIDKIPSAFKLDFELFFLGKTLVKKDNVLFAYPHDVKVWVYFMVNKYNG
ncbi:MAG: hypothetical protein Q8R57_15205 [Bacteroidota bacterium]|nr:hypothetical protein [Bacteroidota bacterium]